MGTPTLRGRSLGNTTKTASGLSKSGENPLSKRYRLQDASRRFLPSERVGICMRTPRAGVGAINVMKSNDSAWFNGTMVCSSVWHCPVCAERISNARRDELQTALATAESLGYRLMMVTYTLSHKIDEPCKSVTKKLASAQRKFKSGRWFQAMKSRVGLIGTIKNIEPLYGKNGWHNHSHEIWVIKHEIGDDEADRIRDIMKARWCELVESVGSWASMANGLSLETATAGIHDYVAKFGRLPESAKYETNLASELAKARTKEGRAAGLTMWELLDMADRGDDDAKKLYQEYAIVFKGKRQLVWSRGLKELLGVTDRDDEEIGEEIEEEEGVVVATIPLIAWQKICQNHMRDIVLQCAKDNEIYRIEALIKAYS